MTASLKRAVMDNPVYRSGELVQVRERGIRPWRGQVISVKWSHVSGWRYDVRSPDDSNVRVLGADSLQRAG